MKYYHQRGRISASALISIIIIALIALSIGIYFGNQKVDLNKKTLIATVYSQPRSIEKFSLTDDEGKPFNNNSLKGHWSLIFFGFTHCPHICPTTMTELNKTYQLIKQKRIKTPQVILISIDPKRDTTERLHAYVKGFNKNFIGATGSQAKIDKLTKDLNVLYLKLMAKNTKNKNDYDIDHSGTIMLFNPQGNLAAIFSMPHEADKIAKDYKTIIKYS